MAKETKATQAARIAELEACLGETKQALVYAQSETTRLMDLVRTRDTELRNMGYEIRQKNTDLAEEKRDHEQTRGRLEGVENRVRALRKAGTQMIEIMATT